MGLFEKALETFDNMQQRYAGKYITGQAPLAPIGFITTNSPIQIMINEKSEFLSATKAKEMILIPTTQKSASRTNNPEPHPLFDKIDYLSGNEKDKREAYLKQLKEWIDYDLGNILLIAVYNYIKKDEIISDLTKYGFEKNKDREGIIRFSVLNTETGEVNYLWKNSDLFISFQKYYMRKIEKSVKNICMVTGKDDIISPKHLGRILLGVDKKKANAKLISSNDKTNFTYRGRFIKASEACTVSYEASQKAHNVLKWLSANQGVTLGERCFLCWCPEGIEIPKSTTILLRKEEIRASEYRQELQKVLQSYKVKLPENSSVIIVAFEAPNKGRLAVTYYNELQASDYLDRLKFWDETCCWVTYDKKVYSPSLWQIVNTAFGTLRGEKGKESFKADDKIVPQMMQTLLSCRVDMAKMPLNFMRALVCKSENLQLYDEIKIRRNLLFTTCAVIKKYRYDYFKEDCQMALEPQKKDRSYQYGRLLAVLEKAEKDTYTVGEERETNAIRMQSVFVNRPAYAAKILIEKVKTGYYPKLNGGLKLKYEKLIGEIMAVISEFPDNEYNKPLSETYLLGYYLQKNSLYAKKENDTENTEVETEE